MKRIQLAWLGLIALLCIAATQTKECDAPPKRGVPITSVPEEQVEGGRFEVEQHGKFGLPTGDGRMANHTIVIIYDKNTHRQYLGVVGVGITQMPE